MMEEDCNVNLTLAIGGAGVLSSSKSFHPREIDLPVQNLGAQLEEGEIKEEECGGGAKRKKLRLSSGQLNLLEESFRNHTTLTPVAPEDQKHELAQRLQLQARQVEVWFQNRRARTKLKQIEMDCDILKKCCDELTSENRRLKRELTALRSSKPGSQFYVEFRKAASANMCWSCEMASDKDGTLQLH